MSREAALKTLRSVPGMWAVRVRRTVSSHGELYDVYVYGVVLDGQPSLWIISFMRARASAVPHATSGCVHVLVCVCCVCCAMCLLEFPVRSSVVGVPVPRAR